jgi:hypothetical protein
VLKERKAVKEMKKRDVGSFSALVRLVLNLLTIETLILAYFGPDTMMPLASGLAAGIGIFLMFWQRGVRAVKSTLRRFSGDRAEPQQGRE